jgi:hypothetical protein
VGISTEQGKVACERVHRLWERQEFGRLRKNSIDFELDVALNFELNGALDFELDVALDFGWRSGSPLR